VKFQEKSRLVHNGRAGSFRAHAIVVTAGAEKQPDIIVVQPLGDGKWKIHAIEVKSGAQTDREMYARLNLAWLTVEKHSGDITKGTYV